MFAHPLRKKILYAMNGPERERSASELGELLGVDVKRLSYHMRELAAIGFIEVVDERPVRGAIERIYAPVKRLEAWDAEWSQLPDVAKQLLASNTLGLSVRAIGASIDSGEFGKRNDSVLSQSTIWADERGAVEALAVLYKAAEDLVRIEAEMKARLAENEEEGFAISYLLAGYEGVYARSDEGLAADDLLHPLEAQADDLSNVLHRQIAVVGVADFVVALGP